jgi:S-adenosylmethionine:tRNA ribosyltransferase-isomerase
MDISAFDYELPEELIAQEPLPQRDASRMLVVDREKQTWTDSNFAEFPLQLNPGDVLVINNTRVFPARIVGRREPSGGRVEVLLVREIEPLLWESLVRPGRRLKQGDHIDFAQGRLKAQVTDAPGTGLRQLRLTCTGSFEEVLDEIGDMPLPPYIARPHGTSAADRERYQTYFARERGAIAAPTAGLHFTPEILNQIAGRGVQLAQVTLHVGYGTFEPVRVNDSEHHRVAAERFEIDEKAASTINETRARGGRVIAVGTTTTRALESAVGEDGILKPTHGNAELTIVPGYRFRITDALLTNFHLPRSSLLMLVSAFAGHALALDAYHHAVEARYRFYSYGDCMIVI